MIEVFLAVIGLLVFVIFLVLPLHSRLLIVLVCSVPQLYLIQISGADVPLAFLLPAILLPEFLRNANRFLAKPMNLCLLVLVLVSAISLTWSSDKSMGIRDIAYLVEFLIISCAVYSMAREDRYVLYKIINLMLIVVCLQAITIILFRLNETLELSIVLSPVSKYFMGGNTLEGLLEGARNNFYDEVKAGGVLFVNANAAACYVGIASFMAWGIFKAANTRISLIMAIFLWTTVFFTGSKAGVMFAILIPLFIIYLKLQKTTKFAIMSLGIMFSILLIYIGLMFGVTEQQGFLLESSETAESRYQIWSYAFNSFLSSPLTGQGFGGWETEYSKFHDYFLPPHNTLIYLWSKSGVLASLLGISFILCCLRVAFRGIKNNDREISNLSFTFLMVIAWQFAHGFGENFGLIGEQHQMIILAIMSGLVISGNEQKRVAYKEII